MNTEIYEKKFNNDLNYINKMIEYCGKNNLKLVVATHYCPTYDVINDEKMRDKYVSLYVSNLDYLLTKEKIHTWICGHIHSNFNIISKNGTRVVGNQFGKPRDNITDYSKELIINI